MDPTDWDEDDDDTPYFDEGGRPSGRDPFHSIVDAYRAWEAVGPTFDLRALPRIQDQLLVGGYPAETIETTSVPWRVGLETFIDHETDGFFHVLAGAFAQARTDLFVQWRAADTAFVEEPHHTEPNAGTSGPRARAQDDDVDLGLPVAPSRARNPKYRGDVLIPYAAAFIALFRSFSKHVAETHSAGHWIGVRPMANGRYTPIPIRKTGETRVPLQFSQAFLRDALELPGSLAEQLGVPEAQPEDAGAWRFLAASDVPDHLRRAQPVHTSPSPDGAKRGGRPRGSGYEVQDAPFVEMILQSLETRSEANRSQAVKRVLRDHERDIAGQSYDAKERRLLRRVAEALGQGHEH